MSEILLDAPGYKVVSPTTSEDAFTVPANKEWALSRLLVVNQKSGTNTYRLSIAPGGAGLAADQYLAYDEDIPVKEHAEFSGLTLSAGTIIRIYAADVLLNVKIFGVERDV